MENIWPHWCTKIEIKVGKLKILDFLDYRSEYSYSRFVISMLESTFITYVHVNVIYLSILMVSKKL